MASRSKVLLVALVVPLNGLLIWGVLSAMGVEDAGRFAREVSLQLAPVGLVLFAGVMAWYWIQQRALQVLDPAQLAAVKSALRTGEGWRLAILLPLIGASHVIPPLVFMAALLAFLVVTTVWLGRHLARLGISHDFVRSYVLGNAAALTAIAGGFGLSLGVFRP